MIDIQAKIRHQALNNAAALKEVGEFVERIAKKDEETKQAAETLDPSTIKLPPVRCYEIPLEEEKSGLYTAEDYKSVGNKLFGERKFEKALCYYECAGRIDPGMAAAFGNAGLCYQKLKRDDEALAAFSRAIEIDPQYAKILVRRGRMYMERENYDAAYADLSTAILHLPEKSLAEVEQDLELVKACMVKVVAPTTRDTPSGAARGKSIAIDMSGIEEAPLAETPVGTVAKTAGAHIGSPSPPQAIRVRDTKHTIPSNRASPSVPPPPTSEFALYSDLCHLNGHPEVLANYLNSFHSALLETYLSSQITDKEVRSVVSALACQKLSAKKTINTLYALAHLPNLHLLAPFLSESTKASMRDTLAWALHQLPEDQAQTYYARNDEIREAFCL